MKSDIDDFGVPARGSPSGRIPAWHHQAGQRAAARDRQRPATPGDRSGQAGRGPGPIHRGDRARGRKRKRNRPCRVLGIRLFQGVPVCATGLRPAAVIGRPAPDRVGTGCGGLRAAALFPPSPPFITKSTCSQHGHVLQRIALHRHQVGVQARLDRADAVAPAEQVGGVPGGGLDRLHRRHAPLHHVGELLAVPAVRIHAGIGGEGHLLAGLHRLAEVLALHAADQLLLGDLRRRRAELGVFGQDVVVVVDVEVEVGAARLGHLQALGIDEAAVLHRVHAGADRHLDRLGAVRVRRHLLAPAVRLVDDRVHLRLRVLRRAHRSLVAEHAGAGHELDHVGTALDVFAHARAHRIDAVGHTAGAAEGDVRREAGAVVGMAAGGADRHGGDQHARAGNLAAVDRVTQRHVEIARRADVAHRGEAGIERAPGQGGRQHRVVHDALGQRVAVVVAGAGGGIGAEMHVHVDQARQQRGVAQVDQLSRRRAPRCRRAPRRCARRAPSPPPDRARGRDSVSIQCAALTASTALGVGARRGRTGPRQSRQQGTAKAKQSERANMRIARGEKACANCTGRRRARCRLSRPPAGRSAWPVRRRRTRWRSRAKLRARSPRVFPMAERTFDHYLARSGASLEGSRFTAWLAVTPRAGGYPVYYAICENRSFREREPAEGGRRHARWPTCRPGGRRHAGVSRGLHRLRRRRAAPTERSGSGGVAAQAQVDRQRGGQFAHRLAVAAQGDPAGVGIIGGLAHPHGVAVLGQPVVGGGQQGGHVDYRRRTRRRPGRRPSRSPGSSARPARPAPAPGCADRRHGSPSSSRSPGRPAPPGSSSPPSCVPLSR